MESFDRPRAVTVFLWLSVLALALGFVNLLILGEYLDRVSLLIVIVSIVLQIGLIAACVARHNWARWVMVVLLGISVINMLFGIGSVFQVSAVAGVLSLALYVASSVGILMLFGSEASEWYRTRPRRERSAAEAAAIRRRLVLGFGGAGAVAVAVFGTIVIVPYLTDWAPYLERCMADGDDPEQAAAIAACTEVIESSPLGGSELADVMVRRGHLALANGERFDAIDDFWHATEEDPENVEAWRSRAEVRLQMGHGHLVLRYVEEALARAPGDLGLITMRGHAYLLEDRNEEALADLERAAAGDGVTAQTYALLGVARTRSGDSGGALEALAASLERDDSDAGTWVLHGEALLNAGRPDEALDSYRQAVVLMPDAADAHLGVVVAHCAGGDFVRANAQLEAMQQARLITRAGWTTLMREWGYTAEETADAETGDDALQPALDAWMADGCPLPTTESEDS